MSEKESKTTVYGQSDDNIYFEGEFNDQYCDAFGCDDSRRGVLVVLSDGTVLEIKYCGRTPGVWEVKPHRKGNLFIRVDLCDDDEAEVYSDVAHFAAGIKWAYICHYESWMVLA